MAANGVPSLSNSNGQTFAAGRAIRRPATMARTEMSSFAQGPDANDTQRLYHLQQDIALAVVFMDGLRVRNARSAHYSLQRCLRTDLNSWLGLDRKSVV